MSKPKKNSPTSVLFVCLGNICRSPAAEGIMQTMVEEAGLSHQVYCDSAGTAAYHQGGPADSRMRAHAKKRGYDLKSIARRIEFDDFDQFDLILTMDDSNYQNVQSLAREYGKTNMRAQIRPFCSYVRGVYEKYDEVPDPYFQGREGFELVLYIVEEGCRNLLQEIQK